MVRLRLEGFQKPAKSAPTKKTSVGVVSYRAADAVRCNCGWTNHHGREKVLEDSIDRHIRKRHGGQGFRM